VNGGSLVAQGVAAPFWDGCVLPRQRIDAGGRTACKMAGFQVVSSALTPDATRGSRSSGHVLLRFGKPEHGEQSAPREQEQVVIGELVRADVPDFRTGLAAPAGRVTDANQLLKPMTNVSKVYLEVRHAPSGQPPFMSRYLLLPDGFGWMSFV